MRKTFLGGILKMANQVGMTPFMPIQHVVRAWPRGFQGGSLQVTKLGLKDCEFEAAGLSLAQIPYFREAYAALLQSATELFGARKAYARVTRHETNAVVMAVSWA